MTHITHIITTAAGKPYKPDHFKHEWKRWTDKASLQGLVFHGLRKTATGNLAEAGCTSEQIKAITGHKTDCMVSHSVAGAKQKERAKAAMKKLETAQLIT
ncbi:MAG: tyrosine-type recombinase/integrase, partial [Bdellovibrionales bacterium]